MGSDVVVVNPLSSSSPLLRHRFPFNNSTSINYTRCFSSSRRPKDYQGYCWDKGTESGFGSSKRIWLSDDDDEYDDEEEEARFVDGFGAMEGSIGFAWVIKVFRAFGWMLPAIIMSAVLGTGTNTIIMAITLPLAQSALSLLMDAFWGWSDEGPRSKYKKKKRRYARAASNPGIRMGKGQNTRNGKGVRDYQSSNGASDRKNSGSNLNFGGWDELDNHGMEREQKKPVNRRPAQPRQLTDGKLSKRIGRRETPLLLRLLFAVFPFLGSWTKLL
ncbi:uncharacterized protein LOC132059583 [Lycium ferocissimum]|uniref:uncharacterized protein LOC132059583 n=1 Tax=Lycium ferocissimum TaxID=112874 RepID=UPI00281661C6|nr:uncharacterized protein LOC132059583 [Lycium ferocissimum]